MSDLVHRKDGRSSSHLFFKKLQVCILIFGSCILNVIALYIHGIETITPFVYSLNIERPTVLLIIILFILSITTIGMYLILTYLIFKVALKLIFKNEQINKLISKYLFLFVLYGYAFVSIWNLLDKIVWFEFNPIVLTIPISNILSYFLICFLLYEYLLNTKVFIIPFVIVGFIVIINKFGELAL